MAVKEICESTYTEVQDPYSGYWYTSDTQCATIQNYCTINGQKASDNITNIDSTFPSFTSGTTIVASNFNAIKDILNQIYNFGSSSRITNQTRGPNTANFESAVTNEKTLLSQYNSILSCINLSTLSSTTAMSASLMDSLRNSIKNYQLNIDRCFTCNTSGNVCGQGCGQGGCGESCDSCQNYVCTPLYEH